VKAALLLVGIALWPGLVHAGKQRPVPISVACDSRNKHVSVTVAGRHIDNIRSDQGERALTKALPDRGRMITVTNSVDTPYRCIGSLIYLLQRLGYLRVGFISEPPAGSSDQG
jgi:hypothetical protein